MAPSALDEKSGVMRETGRESLTFSGMGPAEFSGVPPVEVVHFDGDGGAVNDRKVCPVLDCCDAGVCFVHVYYSPQDRVRISEATSGTSLSSFCKARK